MLKGVKAKGMSANIWEDLEELACSTIMLSLTQTIYFNVVEETTAYGVWTKLGDMYKKHSVASQIFWLKKIFNLKMKEGTSMSTHLNKLNTTSGQLIALEVFFLDSMKDMFLSIMLIINNQEKLKRALINMASLDGLTSANTEGRLLVEKVNRKNIDKGKG